MRASHTSQQESKAFFDKFNIVHEVSAPYHPNRNGMAERLIRSLKNRLVNVNKDQKFNLQLILNIAMSANCVVPHCTTEFSPFVLIYGCEAITPYEVPFTWYTSEEQY